MQVRGLSAGDQIAGRFEIVELIGQGGMGAVYKAKDRLSGGQVAVKLLTELRPEAQDAKRFGREARILSELRHPQIVSFIEHGGLPGGQPFLVMEWLEGEDLAVCLAKRRLDLRSSLLLAQKVAAGLAAAHERGVVHRDIKPSNLFLRGGRPGDLVILDFGIARRHGDARSAPMTGTGSVIGTPEYMAPEQARGKSAIGPGADLFSLGCVLFECISGAPPFAAEHLAAVLAKILFEEAPPLCGICPSVPPAVGALVARLLVKDEAARPQSASKIAAELEAIIASGSADGIATAQPASLAASLTGGEQRLISVVFAAPSGPADDPDATLTPEIVDRLTTQRALIQEALSIFGARVEWLADGSLVAALMQGGSATDQAVLAARCALALQERWPDARISLATGRGQLRERVPVGEVIDRAASLLHGLADQGDEDPSGASADGIRVDTLSAALLEPLFVLAEARGRRTLGVEKAGADEARQLLGKATPCVGREQELGILESTLVVCAEESCARAVLVTAPPGAGKSRVFKELMRRINARGEGDLLKGEMLLARGDPMGMNRPYGLLSQALRRLCGIKAYMSADAQRAALSSRLSPHLSPDDAPRVLAFLGELCALPPSAAGPASADVAAQIFAARQEPSLLAKEIRDALADFFRAECAVQPVLVVFEDMQWADAQSVSVLGELLVELSSRPLMALGLSRPEIHDRFPSLWEGLVQEIPLRGLSKKACERLIYDVLGKGIDATTVARIVDQSAGNALYLEELIRAVADGRGDNPPETVLAMLQARLLQLDPEVRRVLRAASVFGATFWAGGVRTLLGPSATAADVERRCQALFSAEILERHRTSRYPNEAQYGFRHALLRDAAYGLLTEADRKVGHLLAGSFLEEAGERDPLVLIAHYLSAGEPQRAVPHFLRAGEIARRLCSFDEAQRKYAEALELLVRLPDSIQNKRYKIDAILRRVEVTLILDKTVDHLPSLAEADALLDGLAAEGRLSPEDETRKAWIDYTIGRVHYFSGNMLEAIRYYKRMLPAAQRIGSPELVAFPAALMGTALLMQGFASRAAELLETSLAPLERIGDRYELTRASLFYGAALVWQGHVARGFAEIDRAFMSAQSVRRLLSMVVLIRHQVQIGVCNPRDALEYGQMGLSLGIEIGDKLHQITALVTLAWAYGALAMMDQAKEARARAQGLIDEVGGRVVGVDWFSALLSGAALEDGDIEVAAEEALRVARRARAMDLPQSLGYAEHVLGRARARLAPADIAAVDAHFMRALAAYERGDVLLFRANAQLEWALLRKARGEGGEASALYQEAVNFYERCGCEHALENAKKRWSE